MADSTRRGRSYIPALKYHCLTPFFDRFMRRSMPELKFKTALIHQAEIKPDQRVLDFGVGTATLSLLAEQFAPEAQITGIEIDEEISGIARDKISSARARVSIDTYDGSRLPYRDEYFDKVMSSLVFHHLTRAQKAASFRDIHRVLKPGGELHVADWGKARTMAERLGFLPVQLLDGFETTTDNVRGLLPGFMSDAGFAEVRETQTFATMFGTLSLYRGRR